MNETPKTLQQAIRYFSDEQVCMDTVAAMRWPDGPACPRCGHNEHYYLATQKRWKCRKCGKQFSVKVGTIFEDSPIPLDKWLVALWMLVNCKNGVSSYEVARDLGITQKSAWFVLHRLRLALQMGNLNPMGGDGTEVEADETFIGDKARNMHKGKRTEKILGTGPMNKVPVMGLLERGARFAPWSSATEPFHLFRYLDEQSFRYNTRKGLNDGERFHLTLSRVAGKRLTYAEVTGKTAEGARR